MSFTFQVLLISLQKYKRVKQSSIQAPQQCIKEKNIAVIDKDHKTYVKTIKHQWVHVLKEYEK